MDVCLLLRVVFCQAEVSATSWSLVQMSPTDCGASLCVIWKPREWGSPGPQRGLLRHKRKQHIQEIYLFEMHGLFSMETASSNPRRTPAVHPLTNDAEQNSQLLRTHQCTHIFQTSACACVSNAPLAFTLSRCSNGDLSNSLHSDTKVLNDIPNYRYAPHNDVSVNDGPHIRRWSHNVIIL
jgi:hypothetical protein